MHASLRKLAGNKGKKLSAFIANTTVKATNAFAQTSMEIVLEQTKTLMSIFNNAGPKSIGFDYEGKMPRFMVVVDLFGSRCGFHSNSPTLIRELCASFYGPVDGGFGNGSLIRYEIDVIAKQAAALNSSVLLVLSAPWGTAIGDRFWRLCTVRKTEEGKYLDSEYTFSSMQRPPATQGSSVMDPGCDGITFNAAAAAMAKEWRAIDIDDSSSTGVTSTTQAETPNTQPDSKMHSVMLDVIKNLRIRDKEQQVRISELESEQEQEIKRRVEEALGKLRTVWQADVESLHKSLDEHSKQVAIERVNVDALKVEVSHLDHIIIPECKEMSADFKKSLSDLCGKQLVLEDEIKSCSKKLCEARKRDTEVKKERSGFEAILDAKATEVASLRSELESMRDKSSEAKRTASEQITSLLDARSEVSARVDELKAQLKGARADADAKDGELSAERIAVKKATSLVKELQGKLEKTCAKNKKQLERSEADLKAARVCALWTISIYRRQALKFKSAPPASPVPTESSIDPDDQSSDGRGSTGGGTGDHKPAETEEKGACHADLLNLVASSKGLVAHLQSFVEKVQSGGAHATQPTQQQHFSELASYHPQQQQQYYPQAFDQQHIQMYPNLYPHHHLNPMAPQFLQAPMHAPHTPHAPHTRRVRR